MALARTITAPRESELLAAARRGDEEGFRRLVEPHRGALYAHCYRRRTTRGGRAATRSSRSSRACPRTARTRSASRPARTVGRRVAWYTWDAERKAHVANAIEVPDFDGPHVRDITSFVMPELFRRFGLPGELPSVAG